MAKKTKATSAEEKLRALYDLQLIDSRIDRLRVVRGELPLEVEDLEDELAGLEARLERLNTEADSIKSKIQERKESIIDSGAMIKRFEEQQNSVRNNREFESLNKEIEYQSLEIQLSEKRIKEAEAQLELGLTSEQVRSRLGEPYTVHAGETAPQDYYQPGWARREREITGSVEIFILGEPICYVWYDPAGRVEDWFLGGS